MKRKVSKFIYLCLFAVFMVACAPSAAPDNVSVETTGTGLPTATPLPTEQPSIPNISFVPTVTPLPTEEPLPEITFVPTVTPIATMTPADTPTPLPTEPPAEESTFYVTYLDVGQGDAAIVMCDDHYMLIDGGDKECSSEMYSYLKRNEISYLDILVATHAHSDHVGGLPGALNFAKAGLVLCPVTEYDSKAFDDFARYAAEKGPGITVPDKMDTYTLGSAEVIILGLNEGEETNNSSIVLSVTWQDKVFLFTGDAEREAEQALLEAVPKLLDSDVLKVGHHGSDSSTTYPFLREVMPEFAVISCGADNSYGHPTDNTLSRLRDADVTVYRTDLHGDITITFADGEWNITTQKTASEEEIARGGSGSKNNEDTGSQSYGFDYIANKNTKKFHYPDCQSAKKMKESNKEYFNGVTREYMIEQGYDPCGNCDP